MVGSPDLGDLYLKQSHFQHLHAAGSARTIFQMRVHDRRLGWIRLEFHHGSRLRECAPRPASRNWPASSRLQFGTRHSSPSEEADGQILSAQLAPHFASKAFPERSMTPGANDSQRPSLCAAKLAVFTLAGVEPRTISVRRGTCSPRGTASAEPFISANYRSAKAMTWRCTLYFRREAGMPITPVPNRASNRHRPKGSLPPATVIRSPG